MISVVTPTHNPQFLGRAWASLRAQTYQNFEWVIVPNHGAVVAERIFQSPLVRVVPAPSCLEGVGALKKFAFGQAKGDILVELDHDDELMPTCLEKLMGAFADPQIGFAYSDDVVEGPFQPFHANCGWVHGSCERDGKMLPVPIAFEPSAGSICFVWYAPDHVRAWRREVYDLIGGHNQTLEICDDHELLVRTYLATRMKHIPEPLYVYHKHPDGDQTYLKRNEEIQKKTVEICNSVLEVLIARWADLEELPKIDLGGAFDCPAGYTSFDLHGAQITGNAAQGLPFADNSVGVIRASDFLEHIADKQFMLAEIHRVLVDGGWLISSTPSTDGRGAFQDPTHVSFWNEHSFWYVSRPGLARYIRNETVKFQEFILYTHYPSEWHKSVNISYVRAILSAVKSGARRPHFNPWMEVPNGG